MANQAQTISLNKQFNEFSPAPRAMVPTPRLRGFLLYDKDRLSVVGKLMPNEDGLFLSILFSR